MKNSQEIHEKAMEFYHAAKIALAKGQPNEIASEFYQKAYLLEKRAAELANFEMAMKWSGELYRSAAAIANRANLLKEADEMIAKAKGLNPPEREMEKLNEIEEMVSEKRTNNQESSIKISGEFFKANTKDHEISIEDAEENVYDIFVPTNEVKSIAKSFLAQQVMVNARKNSTGLIILENIRPAA